jgi:hypothetical protein
MATNWRRVYVTSTDWLGGTWWITAIPAGQTILRIRFSWTFYLDSPVVTDMQNIAFNVMNWGLVTTIGNGTEAVPDANTGTADPAPPTRRWLWWETRQAVVTAISEQAGVISWRDSGPQDRQDARGQVLATGIPGGDTLNLWASWSGQYNLDPDVSAVISMGASVLTKT